jgi:ABC-type multidrug transport system ATPase subunit
LVELLQRLRDEGRTIVISTHARRILEIADVIANLSEGRLPPSGVNAVSSV